MEIHPHAVEILHGWREYDLCLFGDIEIRDMTLGQGRDTLLCYYEHFCILNFDDRVAYWLTEETKSRDECTGS